MGTVGVKDLKNKLSQYLRRVRRGEEVIVTDRGQPVAILHRIEASDRVASLEARLAGLAAEGVVAMPARRPLRRVHRVDVAGRPLSDIILEERG